MAHAPTAILLSAAMVAVVLYWWLAPSPTGVAEFRRLELGMTSAEVEDTIGLPTGYYGPRYAMSIPGKCIRSIGIPYEVLVIHEYDTPSESERTPTQTWTWSRYWITVAFNKEDRAVGVYLFEILR
jgi:hypothetical protein